MTVAAAIQQYDVGDVATVTASFKSGTIPADPSTVTATVTAPDYTVTAYTVTAGQIVQDSVGEYHLDIPCALVGDYFYVFTGIGPVAASEPGTFHVRPSPVPAATALTTLGAAREYVLRNAADGTQDTMLRRLIDSYSEAVYRYTRREWLPASNATARKFAYDGSGFLSLAPYEARSVTAVTLFTDTPTSSQRVLEPGSATVESEFRPGPRGGTTEGTYLWLDIASSLRGFYPYTGETDIYWSSMSRDAGYEVTITGNWGIGSVPGDVELALLVAIKDAYENPAGYETGTEGGLQFVEATEIDSGPDARARNLPVESRALLTPYKRGSQVVTA